MHKDVEWDMSRSPFPDARVYRGRDGVREWFQGLADAFGEVVYEVERMHEAGSRVAVQFRVRGRGPSSGIPVDYRFVPLMTFRAGKIVHMERYGDWDSAMAEMNDRGEGA
jgi:ketosteroid isomerase-like protein